VKWFKHDSDAQLDAKLQRLRLKYGMEGYGLYWFCLEAIARNVEKHNLTFELEDDAELISAAVGMHYEKVQEMMVYMVKLGLFEESEGRITCIKMALRTDEYTQKLIKDAGGVQILSRQTPESVVIMSELREEKRTEEKRIGQNRKRFVPPTHDEVVSYMESKGCADARSTAQRFMDFYESKGWMVGKNKMKNWRAATGQFMRDTKPNVDLRGGI